jgi:hypothetical protein
MDVRLVLPAPMTREEAESFVADGRSVDRRRQFRDAEEATRAWRRSHPATLDDVIDLIMQLQEIFGPFSSDRPATVARDMRR